MKRERKERIAEWAKRVIGVLTVLVWIGAIVIIYRSFDSFEEEAPYCIVSTMVIFGISSAMFKGLDYWKGLGE
jgi:heme A synthase